MTEKSTDNSSSTEIEDGAMVKSKAKAKANSKAHAKAGSQKEPHLTKRQRRKKVNDTHKWPQHPKMQSMEKRNKAYLRVAGLGQSTGEKEKEKKPSSALDPKLDLMSPEVRFGRILGDPDQRTRHLAVKKLETYLKERCDVENKSGGISELDLMRLWKGLWYTLYMADKVPVQDELSQRLAELIWCVAGTEEEDEFAGQEYLSWCREQEEAAEIMGQLEEAGIHGESEDEIDMEQAMEVMEDLNESDEEGEEDSDEDIIEVENTLRGDSGDDDDDDEEDDVENGEDEDEEMRDIPSEEVRHCRGAHLASILVTTFFRTIKREWPNMDKYRIDKFYTLIRLFMHQVFKYMALRHWNAGIVRLFNDCIYEEVLNQTPNGIRYHLIDLALEELAKVNRDAPMPLTEATFLDVMEPYFGLAQDGAGESTVQSRVVEQVLEKFLEEYCAISDRALKAEEEDDEEAHGIIFSDVHIGTVAKFIFEVASSAATQDRYRKSLYDMHKAYNRRLKKIGKDVAVPSEHDSNGDEEGIVVTDDDDEDEAAMEGVTDDLHDQSMDAGDEETENNDTLSKKKRKKKTKKDKVSVRGESQVDTTHTDGEEPMKPSKKKKRADPDNMDEKPATAIAIGGDKKDITQTGPEEEVTISVAEQKVAVVAEKKRKERRNKLKKAVAKEQEVQEEQEPSSKRVKFSRTLVAKSWKASMKGLDKAPWKTAPKESPEKSILLNKDTRSPVAPPMKRKSRKARALDYF